MLTLCLMATSTQDVVSDRKLMGVRVTPEQRERIADAARREQRSVSSFVVRAALEAADGVHRGQRKSREEVRAILQAARAEVREANPENRSLLDELIEERRKEAASA
jgi:uncharacterized protein (DUF1778 family)